MKKKLLAVAIAGAVAAPVAMADEGNVTIYGQANAAIESTDADGTGASGRSTNVASNGSRLGVKGWEALGNGLKAVFLMEAGVGLDDGVDAGSALIGGGRDGYIGVAGDAFGTVALGFHGQPYKTSTNGMDIFGDTIADYSSVMNGYNGNAGAYDSGIDNAIIWFLPNLNGFSGHLQYGFDETAGSSADDWGAQFNYSNGPLYVTYAHADVESATANSDRRADKIGASYTFMEATTVSAIYEWLTADSAVAVAERDAFYIALSHNFGNNTAKIAYANADDSDATGASDGADYWAIGLDHNLSKRTKVYALYTSVDNEAGGTYGLGTTGSSNSLSSVGAGKNPSAFAVGMKHSF
ncbi:MAG: porin [Gammaproteobacteria bacterium]|nr:porin [Gammaproteobacteria bacterium]